MLERNMLPSDHQNKGCDGMDGDAGLVNGISDITHTTSDQMVSLQSMPDVIDSLVASQEQSYDEFLDCFTYLQKDDPGLLQSHLQQLSIHSQDTRHDRALHTACMNQARLSSNRPAVTCVTETIRETDEISSDEAIEEETLPEGTVAGALTTSRQHGCLQTKFDNFIDACDGSEDDEYEDAVDDSPFKQDSQCNCQEDMATGYIATVVSSPGEREVTPACQTDPSTHKGDHSFIQLNSDGDLITTNLITEVIEKSGIETDNSEKLLFPGEADRSDEENEVEDVCTRYRNTILDMRCSVGDVADLSDRHKDIEGSCQSAGDNVQCWDDQVESFSLDPDFDYDNVTLSPKYGPEEMAVIRQYLQRTDISDG